MGEALVTAHSASVFVDGRYWLQAEREVPAEWSVVRVPHGRAIDDVVRDRVAELGRVTLGLEADRWVVKELEKVRSELPEGAKLELLNPSPVEAARGELEPERATRAEPAPPELRVVSDERVGHRVEERLERLFADVDEAVPAVWVHALDDIAYLSGLRARDLPHQATFRSVAVATRTGLWVGLVAPTARPAGLPDAVELMSEQELWARIEAASFDRVGFDPARTTCAVRAALEARGIRATPVDLPLAHMKAVKTDAEIGVMQEAFRRADRAVRRTIQWACDTVDRDGVVTEASFADQIERNFAAEGALGQSFRTISAAGPNGAIIHYGTPSPERALRRGELMLVDCGAHFDEGYATDLTRTFLVGNAHDRGDARQVHLYTTVLKAAIAGMTARFPRGTTGGQLDAIVRAPIWAEGMTYAHGTGHGVGINVHEFPPRISPNHESVLEPNMVFSIEPGIYIEDYGGVRIENLCTIRESREHDGFLEVAPLTFSPLDPRLIDLDRLTDFEKSFLNRYALGFESSSSHAA
jgi:Xaa-Pro aminopeptidase